MPYGRDKSKTQNVAAQAAFLSSKLNFGPPSKAAPQPPPRANNTTSRDPNFSANRNAIADKIAFGGRKPPPDPIQRQPAAIPKPSGGKEFQNQKNALAAKLNFRPPLPAGDPRTKPSNAPPSYRPGPPPVHSAQRASAQNGTQDFSANRAAIANQLAFGKSKPASSPKPNPPPPRRNDNNGTEFSNQKAALASKLVFRPPLPASQTSGGPQAPPSRPPPRPQEPSYAPAPAPVPAGNVGLAAQAAAAGAGLRSRYPEDATTSSSDAASMHSGRSMNPPPEPVMSFAQSPHSIHKENPPPAEPDMHYVRSYRIGGAAATEKPKHEPMAQQAPAGDENGRIQVLLVSEKFEWGTKPLNKKYDRRNRVKVKHFTTLTPEEERKRERNKNGGGGCTVM